MFLVSQTIANIKQITQCYLTYLTHAKMKTQYYSANLDLLYLYNFNRIANLNAFTIVFFFEKLASDFLSQIFNF